MSSTVLSARRLSLQIGSRTLVSGLDLDIRPGECWCILGRNGSGKTTLLHTLAGLRSPDSGNVVLNDAPIARQSRHQIARQLGLLSQDHEDVFPATVLQTALMGRHPHLSPWAWESDTDIALAREALQQVGLEALQEREVTTLSGGERRRLGIATLLCQDPQFLLLDEPTNHLDLHHQIDVLQGLVNLAREHNKALVMVLHDVNLASRFCDHALLLFDDGPSLVGSATELFNEHNLGRLYGHPMRRLAEPPQGIWIPE